MFYVNNLKKREKLYGNVFIHEFKTAVSNDYHKYLAGCQHAETKVHSVASQVELVIVTSVLGHACAVLNFKYPIAP
jgi:hypothetical protein